MDPNALSEEELERIRKNLLRARELRQEQRNKEQQSQQETKKRGAISIHLQNEGDLLKSEKKKEGLHGNDRGIEEEGGDVLEDFEKGASDYITKEQASKLYCLPTGSIELCSFIIKENPKCPKFAPMKLFSRKEIRKRAHERYGGLQGLQQERRKRGEKRLKKDMESCENIFDRAK